MDDERIHHEVQRFWSEIAAGGPASSGDLDPALAETIERVQQGNAVPPPNSAWMKQLREELMDAQNGLISMHAWSFDANGHIAALAPNGVLSLPVDRPGRVGSVFSFAAAAVLLLALAGGLVAIRFGMPGSDDGRFGSIPAAQVSPDATPPAGPVEFLWETRGDPADPLGNPAHVAIAPDGAIWVADGDNNRFQIFAPDGTHLESWGTAGSGEGQFDFTAFGIPGYGQAAIAFAPDGTFYVADPGNRRIQKFGPDRRFLLAWGSEGREPGQFITPVDLVVDAQGHVYVVDHYRNYPADETTGAVQVFDADGRFLAEWGTYGAEPGQLSEPFGIGLDPDGTLLVAEYVNNRVQRFTAEGELLKVVGGFGTDDGEFAHAMDAAVDDQGRVFVTDYSNHRVQVFDRDGAFLAAWGEFGTNAGEFSYALGVAVGPDGTVYVTDEFKRLQAFRVGTLPAPAATPTS